jgi:hypothetical protein
MWPNDYFSFGQNGFNKATFGHFLPWPNEIFPFGQQLFHSARIAKNDRRIGHLATLSAAFLVLILINLSLGRPWF